jgi:hypothetical protein
VAGRAGRVTVNRYKEVSFFPVGNDGSLVEIRFEGRCQGITRFTGIYHTYIFHIGFNQFSQFQGYIQHYSFFCRKSTVSSRGLGTMSRVYDDCPDRGISFGATGGFFGINEKKS